MAVASAAECKALPWEGKYRPLYRLKPEDRWAIVRRDRKPVECETYGEALRIARDLVDAIERPAHVIEDEPQPLGSTDQWKKDRDASIVAERAKVFAPQARVFLKGREVPVIRKKRKVLA